MTADNSFASQAYAILKKDLLSCVLMPGSRVAQPELVKRYDLGVTPIREALKRLEHEGFVRSLPRYGYLITPITIKDVENLYDFRIVLEKASVHFAIEKAPDCRLTQIQQAADFSYVYKDRGSYLDFLDQNARFHVSIAASTGNTKLADVLTTTLNEMIRIFNLGLDLRDSASEMRREHIDLVQAMSARDGERAEKIIVEQITSSRKRVMEMLVQYHAQ
ncbi:MAG TPA: GntR family transcriptional regulator [Anaerolineaceae bacterium]